MSKPKQARTELRHKKWLLRMLGIIYRTNWLMFNASSDTSKPSLVMERIENWLKIALGKMDFQAYNSVNIELNPWQGTLNRCCQVEYWNGICYFIAGTWSQGNKGPPQPNLTFINHPPKPASVTLIISPKWTPMILRLNLRAIYTSNSFIGLVAD